MDEKYKYSLEELSGMLTRPDPSNRFFRTLREVVEQQLVIEGNPAEEACVVAKARVGSVCEVMGQIGTEDLLAEANNPLFNAALEAHLMAARSEHQFSEALTAEGPGAAARVVFGTLSDQPRPRGSPGAKTQEP